MPRRPMPCPPASGSASSGSRPAFWLAGVALSSLLLLPACSDGPRSSSDLTAPRNHLLREDRGASGGEDVLKGGVNAYLWRATLDTLSFMPVSTADAEGGIILTDWHTPPAAHGERFKITAFILDRRLRSDALRLTVFRQVQQGGEWVDTPPSGNTASDIAARILSRARKLRADNGNRDD